MIFKVLVLGRNILLQTGFLNRVSGESVTNQLYNTLGVSIGITRNEEREDTSIVLQLWSLPLVERLRGLSKTFTKGHRGVIAVASPDELDQLPALLNSFDVNPGMNLIVVIVGDVQGVESELLRKLFFDQANLDVHSIASATDAVNILSNQLQNRNQSNQNRISIVFLDESQCPLFEPRITRREDPPCADHEVEEISSILINQGIRVFEDSCLVELKEGAASISLRTGSVRLEPVICNYCRFDCKRQTNICIIAVDSGWSTQDIGQRALLTAAKVLALSERKLPSHVEMQIQRASVCARFEIDPDLLDDNIPADLFASKPRSAFIRKTLLEVASERVKEGRLPETAYNMLKRRFDSLQNVSNM